MNKKIIIVCLTCFIFLLQGCSTEPSEEELSEKGYLLSEAIDEFNALDDNYMYKYELHQTNGEDWFVYTLAKFYQGDVYVQSDTYHTNTGWQNKDLILTNYSDVSDVAYQVYDFNENQLVRHYYKFKYNDSDESFQKLYKDDSETTMNQLNFNYQCFSANDFENVYDSQTEVISNQWNMNNEALQDAKFKEALIEGFDLGSDFEEIRIDYVYLFVNDSLVSKLQFGYWGGYNDQNMYHFTIEFDRDNYAFDISALTSGFVNYETVLDE